MVYGEETKKGIEAPSPDGQFAFRYTGDANSEKQTYDLIDKASRKVLLTVATADPDMGPSARFHMEVLWRPDSKAFALTARLWKRGTYVAVFSRERAAFREIKLPELTADIPEEVKKGKSYPHFAELNSQSAKRWQKDGSLVVEIENMQDGNDGAIIARRTVVLGFDQPGKGSIVKSTVKYEIQTDSNVEAQNARDKGDQAAAMAIYNRALKADGRDPIALYHRGCAYYVNREWAKALADFQRHCDLRKDETNQIFAARFYIWLIRARLGDREKADKAITPYMAGHPAEWSGGWDAKTCNFLLGKMSEGDFVAALDGNPAAWFYAGMKRLLDKDSEGAAIAFKKSVEETADKTTDEYRMAESELKALTK